MKLSLWHKGHHIELEGTKDEIMDFLDGLEQPEITFTPNETYSPPAYWGGYPITNPDGSIVIPTNDYYSGISASQGNLTDICTQHG